jgi:hypothetical protein
MAGSVGSLTVLGSEPKWSGQSRLYYQWAICRRNDLIVLSETLIPFLRVKRDIAQDALAELSSRTGLQRRSRR